MSQAIKNVLNKFAFDKVETMIENKQAVTPEVLDAWVKEIHPELKASGASIGKNSTREILVQYILGEFDIEAFGLTQIIELQGDREISDKTIRRMKNQRKKGFVDLKIVKAA